MKIYEFNDYRKLLKAHILEVNRFKEEKLTYEKLASRLRIQKSYLSKIFKGDADLSRDQAYLCSKELDLSEKEEEYFYLLIELSRTALPEFKKELSDKIKILQLQNTQSIEYLKEKSGEILESNQIQKYYLLPETQLIHLALGLERYQKNPEDLKDQLNISGELLKKSMTLLEELKLIEMVEGKIKLSRSNMHLENSSEFFHQWHVQFKLKCLEKLKALEQKDKYNFLVTFSAEEEDKEKIRIEFLNFIKKVETIVKKSPPKSLYQMNFDLFKWL